MGEGMIVHHNFWSEESLSFLKDKISDYSKNTLPLKLQSNWWAKTILEAGASVLIYSLSKDESEPLKKDVSKVCDTGKFTEFWSHIYFWQRGSYIPWHEDGVYEFVGTTYLNEEEWDYNWGGAGLYKDEDGNVSAHFPKYNTLIAQYGNGFCEQYHGTSILSQSSPVRITLQTFGR